MVKFVVADAGEKVSASVVLGHQNGNDMPP
jgi:hypothetical protein